MRYEVILTAMLAISCCNQALQRLVNVKRLSAKKVSLLPEGFEERFSNIARLYGPDTQGNMLKLSESSVCVIGLGGVGSWVVEALAR